MGSALGNREQHTTEFLEVILRLDNLDDCRSLFQVVLTDAELERLHHRWPIVRLLTEGLLTNREIAATLGVSTTTVSATNARLKREGGALRSFLERLRKSNTWQR